MRCCPAMRAVVADLTRQHHARLTQIGDWLKLEQDGLMPLVIEVVGPQRISVAHYYYQHGDACPDPEILFWTDNAAGWMPLWCQQVLGFTEALTLADNAPARINPPVYADLVEFADLWAANLRAQGWQHACRTDTTPPLRAGADEQAAHP